MFARAFLVLLLAGKASSFAVTTNTPTVTVPENAGADLACSYSADFGIPRIEWMYMDKSGSETLIFYEGQPTSKYTGRVEQYQGGLRFNKVTRQDNGNYTCAVYSSTGVIGKSVIKLIVQVAPSPPICGVPSSVTTGSRVVLTCFDKDGSPDCTYKWFKNQVPMPVDPSKIPAFQNSSYVLNPTDGTLVFPRVAKKDAGQYYCTAANGVGSPASCGALQMAVNDVNTGGIVAGVIVALLALGLLLFALWYANRKGYLPKKSESKPKVVYSQPPAGLDQEDGEFRQKSSFVV
ncbi:junctional adhesion molecule A [Amia ocellicauda]|uniref:junctional adhesion molecule A n=1 Tax=Amia ocellicauda TaxID=2972642 RepID=UPI0034642054